MSTRNWVFTDHELLEELWDKIECRYIQYGRETCPTTGKKHLQGFICFEKPKRLSAMKKIDARVHWEQMKGRLEHNVAYTSKEGDVYKRGELPMESKTKGEVEKVRWAIALKEAKETGEVSDPRIAFVYAKTSDFIHQKELKKIKFDFREPECLWYWGASGTGKSYTAHQENPIHYEKGPNKWWNGYARQPVVIIDEFAPEHAYLISELKRWTDGYSRDVECKGGSINVRPEKFIITSNYHPSQIWEKNTDLDPIYRRFTIVEFNAEAGFIVKKTQHKKDSLFKPSQEESIQKEANI